MHTSEPHTVPFPSGGQQRAKAPLEYRRLKYRLHLFRHWWLSPHKAYQAVFVVAGARSGSTLLTDYLDQLPGVQGLSEVLNWGTPMGPLRHRRAKAVIKHLRLSFQSKQSPIRTCKVTVPQLNNFRLTLSDIDREFPGAKFIVLYRQSLAEQFVSLCQAQSTKQWHLRAGQQPQLVPITIDPAELREYCETTRRGYENVVAYPPLAERGTILSYEELTADPARCLRERVCPLLGVPAIEPKTETRKQNPHSLADRVSNYSEIKELLGSPLCRQQHALPGRSSVQRKAA